MKRFGLLESPPELIRSSSKSFVESPQICRIWGLLIYGSSAACSDLFSLEEFSYSLYGCCVFRTIFWISMRRLVQLSLSSDISGVRPLFSCCSWNSKTYHKFLTLLNTNKRVIFCLFVSNSTQLVLRHGAACSHRFEDSKISQGKWCSRLFRRLEILFVFLLLLFVWGNFRYSTGSSSSYVCISHYKSVSVIYSCMHKKKLQV